MRDDLPKLICGTLGIFLPILLFVYVYAGAGELVRAASTFSICLPIAVISLGLTHGALSRDKNWQVGVILGCSVGRIVITLSCALLLFWLAPQMRGVGFWLWIVFGYLLTLTLEVLILLRAIQRAGQIEEKEA